MTHFHDAISETFKELEGHPQYDVWINYALSTNERGQCIVKLLYPYTSFKEKRHLDIGCAHGGTCISMAKEGCESIGIDYDNELLNFAKENMRDHPGINVYFKNQDIMDQTKINSLGTFDIITCQDVTEHVKIPERLIAHIKLLLNHNGILHFVVPNPLSINLIRKEPHYGLYGCTLLDPYDATILFNFLFPKNRYDVAHYYTIDYYEYLFKKFGFRVLENRYQPIESLFLNIDIELIKLREEYENAIIPKQLKPKMKIMIDEYIKRVETDIYYLKSLDNNRKNEFKTKMLKDYFTDRFELILTNTMAKRRIIEKILRYVNI